VRIDASSTPRRRRRDRNDRWVQILLLTGDVLDSTDLSPQLATKLVGTTSDN